MHTTITTISALLAVSLPATFAAPSAHDISPLHARNNIAKVGFGRQIQNEDQAEHWVVWVEGESACPVAIALGPLTGSPCGIGFTLPDSSEATMLSDCVDNFPQALKTVNNPSFITACVGDDDKISCGGNEHDIVKQGKCVQ